MCFVTSSRVGRQATGAFGAGPVVEVFGCSLPRKELRGQMGVDGPNVYFEVGDQDGGLWLAASFRIFWVGRACVRDFVVVVVVVVGERGMVLEIG